MATAQQLNWLQTMYDAALSAVAKMANGPYALPANLAPFWAKCAACEAADETGWGIAEPPNSRNVLGIKALGHYAGPYVTANGTEENADGTFTPPTQDRWRQYDSPADCFADQLEILATQIDHRTGKLDYAAALAATTPEAYIAAECAVWSTGQAKGQAVTQIFHAHASALHP